MFFTTLSMFRFSAFQQYLPHIIDTLIKSLHLPISCRFDNRCRKANHPASIVDHGWFYRPKLWHEQPLIKVKRSCHHQIAPAPILRPSLFIFADHSLPKYRRIDRRRLTRNGAITSKCPKITFSAEWNWLRSHDGVVVAVFIVVITIIVVINIVVVIVKIVGH